ncbi:MAG TPA: alpha/beta hydrolase [Pseudonocardiaceae bacterium]|nr:alpha/beta hydrolase [Pseudonocardiaceae bacterium]
MQSTTVVSTDIEIAYETFGAPGGRPLLLVMGLGAQMLEWHPDLCATLAAENFFVVRFDNRDVGLSTHLHDAPSPNLDAAMNGDISSAAYRLEDMADDAIGLLDALGLDQAHVVGASMGGMIAQTMAIRHPDRVRSLTSIMSTPCLGIGASTPAVQAAFSAPSPASRAERLEWTVALFKVIGSPAYPMDEAWLREVAGQSYDRNFDPTGVIRQVLAIYASGDRTAALTRVMTPALVIHGEADPVFQLPAGRATAAALPNAELLVVPGMGHDLPRAIWPTLVAAISRLADRAEALPTSTMTD